MDNDWGIYNLFDKGIDRMTRTVQTKSGKLYWRFFDPETGKVTFQPIPDKYQLGELEEEPTDTNNPR